MSRATTSKTRMISVRFPLKLLASVEAAAKARGVSFSALVVSRFASNLDLSGGNTISFRAPIEMVERWLEDARGAGTSLAALIIYRTEGYAAEIERLRDELAKGQAAKLAELGTDDHAALEAALKDALVRVSEQDVLLEAQGKRITELVATIDRVSADKSRIIAAQEGFLDEARAHIEVLVARHTQPTTI